MHLLERDQNFCKASTPQNPEQELVGFWTEASGESVRIVPVVAVQLERQDGMVFTQLGRFEHGLLRTEVVLPGGYVLASEVPATALQRILSTVLEPLRRGIVLGDAYFTQEQFMSPTTGEFTRYLRLITKASLAKDFDVSNLFQPVKRSQAALRDRGGTERSREPRGHSGLVQRFNVSAIIGRHAPDIFALADDELRQKGIVPLFAWMPIWEFEDLYLNTDNPRSNNIVNTWLADLDLGPFVMQSWTEAVQTKGGLELPGLQPRPARSIHKAADIEEDAGGLSDISQ